MATNSLTAERLMELLVYEPQSNNQLGLLGVCQHQNGFRARISVNGKDKCLGVYDTPEFAHQVYIEAKRRLHPGFVP